MYVNVRVEEYLVPCIIGQNSVQTSIYCEMHLFISLGALDFLTNIYRLSHQEMSEWRNSGYDHL